MKNPYQENKLKNPKRQKRRINRTDFRSREKKFWRKILKNPSDN